MDRYRALTGCVVGGGAVLWLALYLALNGVCFILLVGLGGEEETPDRLLAVVQVLWLLFPLVLSLLVGMLVSRVLGRRSVVWATILGPMLIILLVVLARLDVPGIAIGAAAWPWMVTAHLPLAAAGGYAGGIHGALLVRRREATLRNA